MIPLSNVRIMEFLSSSITYIVIFIVAVTFFKRLNNNIMRRGGPKSYDPGSAGSQAGMINRGTGAAGTFTDTRVKNAQSYGSAAKNRSSYKSDNGLTLKDDRNSDWLARQLRDEEKAMRNISDMFQLKQEHANKCDAEFIRRFHESYCDADGIDDGIQKR